MSDPVFSADPSGAGGPASAAERRHLERLRDALMEVHKAMLDAERERYEQAHGPIPSNAVFLQLVIHHERFAWLQPVTATVVRIDDRTMSRRAPLQAHEVPALAAEAMALLRPDAAGTAFQRQFHALLRAAPAVAVAVRTVVEALMRAPDPQG